MVVPVETTALAFQNIVTGVIINCAFPAFSATDISVIYGLDALTAEQGVDFTVAIAADFTSFTVTPLAPLLVKINALIAGNAAETNSITVRRTLDYKTSNDTNNVHYVTFLSQEFDRTAMRFQQIAEQIERAITLSPKNIGGNTHFYIDAPVGGSLLIWSADGGTIQNGPTPLDISGVQASTAADVALCNAAASAAEQSETDAETALMNVQGIAATVAADAASVAAALAGATANVKAAAGDTTPGNLTDKIVVSGGLLSLSTLVPAGNAQRQILLTKSNLVQAQAGADDTTVMTPVRVLDAIAANIQNIAASQITSGTISTARLGSGAASSATYLRGDQTWAASPVSVTAGAVGTYAWCVRNNGGGTYNFGDTCAGANLEPSSGASSVGSVTSLSGTWECRGYSTGTSSAQQTLWQRIA